MTNYYNITRKEQIYTALSTQALLTEDAFYHKDLLPALKSFADAMLSIVIEKEHASHLTIRELSMYLREQASAVGLEADFNITYATRQLELLSKNIYGLEIGNRGESRANRAMFGIDSPNQILKNIEVVLNDEPYESDFIVINKSGIYVIESKYRNHDMIIDEFGYFVPADSNYQIKNPPKIRTQMANQRAAIRKIIEQAFPDNERMLGIAENVKSVLLFTGDHRVVDVLGVETILNCDNIVNYLNTTSGETKLSRDEIHTIAEAINAAHQPQKHAIGYDYKRVADAFAIAIAKIEFATERQYGESYEEPDVFSDETAHGEQDDIPVEEAEQKNTVENHSKKVNGWNVVGKVAIGMTAFGMAWKIAKKILEARTQVL